MNNVNTPLPNCIAGVSGGSNIAELWREQFSELLNCISDTTDGIDRHCCYTDEMVVSVNEVNEGISRLECGGITKNLPLLNYKFLIITF